MSYSKLVSYVKISPNSNNPRNHKIDKITIHHTAGKIGVENLGSIFADPKRQGSSNYGIGYDGRIACYVEEENRSWCSSSRDNDHRAITIEVSNSDNGPTWAVSDEAMESLIQLCVDVCQRHGFRLNFTGDKTGNLTMHKWFAATGCPGPWLEPRFPEIAAEVNRRLDGEPAQGTKPESCEGCIQLPTLQKGSKGENVRAMQILLIGRGVSCGSSGADGDFGTATLSAAKTYQKKNGLAVDGIVGKNTWRKLLGL